MLQVQLLTSYKKKVSWKVSQEKQEYQQNLFLKFQSSLID